MTVNATSPSPRPKGDKRERTRAKLLEAARDLVRERGHEHTTVEDVARRAGMTSGAVYGNFKNREALFLALGQTYWADIKPETRPGSSFAETMQALAEATIAAIPERQAAGFGRLNGMAYALSHQALRNDVTQLTKARYVSGAAWLSALALADELPMPADVLVVVIHALTEGLVFQRLMTPDLVSDEVIRAAFAALAAARPPISPIVVV